MEAIAPALDNWLSSPSIRVCHRREGNAPVEKLWGAAREVRVRDTQLLGRLVRWRIPGTTGDIAYDELFRRPPFVVLEQSEYGLVSGLVGKIWTLKRDYPLLSGPDEFVDWSRGGTARVVFASWAEPLGEARAALCSEARVEGLGRQGRLGLATVRPLVRGFQHVIGTDGIAAAVRRAEQG